MKAKIVLLSVLLLVCLSSMSQTGPGGVGTNNGTSDLIIWYRPDNGIITTGNFVDSWINSAGVAAFNVTETNNRRPSLVNNAINGYPEVSFTGSRRLRTGLTLTTTNFITNQASSFVVSRADNTTQTTSVYSTDPLTSNRFQAHIPWSNVVYFDIGACCGAASRILQGGLAGLTNYSIFTYDANPTTGKQLYRNGTLLQNRANTSTYSSHNSQRFTLGFRNFQGDITELVIYRTTRNTAERIIVDNYLAAKFNQTLNVNDFYNEDDTGAGNFDHKVAGIGQAADGSNHTNSQGTGIVSINNPNDLQNNEFLFWGENQINSNYDFSDVTTTTEKYRLNTAWRVSETGNLGTVNFSINSSDLDFTGTPSGTLRLVRSTVSDFSTITQEYDLTLTSGVYSTTVDFNDNDYFTLEIVPIADLSLTSSVNKSIPKVGDIVLYTITLKNDGPQDATGVMVKSLLPSGLAYNMANTNTPSTTTYNASSGIWDLSSITIANGQTVVLTLAATAQTNNAKLTNTAEIIATNQEDTDSTPNNQN